MEQDSYLLFTPGPVSMSKNTLKIGSKQLPYFRTTSFSTIIKNCEENLLAMTNAPEGSRCLFLASSGTGAMDAIMTNFFDQNDHLLIVNGGEFGKRFTELSLFYKILYSQIVITPGKTITYDHLNKAGSENYAALLINGHETSTGVLYDLNLTGQFCSKNNMLHIVDGISLFLNDELDMKKQSIDVIILSSQKGLALPPGLSVLVLSPNAIDKINRTSPVSYYFNLRNYLENMLRFQTPFTPPVGIIMQLRQRLEDIVSNGGVTSEVMARHQLATYFREKIKAFPLKIFSERPSNGITALSPTDDKNAHDLVKYFEANYKMYLCPNGGALKNEVFRVSHMGDINYEYIDMLIKKFYQYYDL